MNGSVETSAPSSPASTDKKVTSKDCEPTVMDCENSSNHNGSEENSLPEETKENNEKITIQKNSNGSVELKPDEPTKPTASKVPELDNSNENDANNYSADSNQSYTDSEKSHKQETDDGKVNNGDSNQNCKVILMQSEDEDSEVGSSLEYVDGESRPDDVLSINSDTSGDGEQNKTFLKNMINILTNIEKTKSTLENANGDSPDSEVQEILSDNEDCVVVTNEEKKAKKECDMAELRRSTRNRKKKNYEEDEEVSSDKVESDIEEISLHDPLRKNEPIVINDTKHLVEMAAKQMRNNAGNHQKKEPTVVIIDTKSLSGKSGLPIATSKPSTQTSSSSINAQNLYQSIVARGTTVTPVSSKNNAATSTAAAAPAQPLILPSLTDDMFVVEAPSFIVPYVYEKPSVKPFREFVDELGKELAELKAKLDEDGKQNDDSNKDKADGAIEMDTEAMLAAGLNDKKKANKKAKRRRNVDDEDDSWEGTSSSSDDDIPTDEDVRQKSDKDATAADLQKANVTKPTVTPAVKSDSYFDCSLGKFFVNIGLNLVQEYVQTDLLKQQVRKINREKKLKRSTRELELSVASLTKNLEFSQKTNKSLTFEQKKCEFCTFKTESLLAMANHLETPHMKNNMYKCNFCSFEIKSPHDILYHLEVEHNVRGRLERSPSLHQCANCPFEDNGKGKLARHLIPCARKFKPDTNLMPPVDWEPPAKIPKIAKARANPMGAYANMNRVQSGMGMKPLNVAGMIPSLTTFRSKPRVPIPVTPRGLTIHGPGSLIRNNLAKQNSTATGNAKNAPKSLHQPSISITPLPRQPQPAPQNSAFKANFVICEICDGYIKDLEQLRNHMQWIHKVKIHPKMIYNRPPLNCQKCQFRFFTDQGLERHLLGSHGLVTSSMQEAANKGKDAGRCPVCGRVYQWKLLNHVAKDHHLTLKPAHLSYKCTVCTATFGMYKLFESHVYSAHSVVAKRVMDKGKANTQPAKSESVLKPVKINDEITITPQPGKSSPTVKK